MKKIILLTLLVISFQHFTLGQDSVSKGNRHFKNIIRINPTPSLVFSNIKNITLIYERLVNESQSIEIQLGYLEFRPILKDSIEGLFSFDRRSNFGVNVAFDYKFYPLKRNIFRAPNGLYIGPYISYYGFKFTDEVTLNVTGKKGDLTSGFNYINAGFMVGYQFIFWKRLAIDLLVFGPSLTCRLTTTKLDAAFTESEKNDMMQILQDKLQEKYPALTPFVDFDGRNQVTAIQMFFRYSISIGFHF